MTRTYGCPYILFPLFGDGINSILTKSFRAYGSGIENFGRTNKFKSSSVGTFQVVAPDFNPVDEYKSPNSG